jgi:hypothetical protein
MIHAQHTRHTPAHQVGQEHRPDHQGDADGGGVQDAQGAAGRAGRASVCGFDERVLAEAGPRIASFKDPLMEIRDVKKRAVIVVSTDAACAAA